MKSHLEYALEEEKNAEAKMKAGDLERALWHRMLAVQGWRDFVATCAAEDRAAAVISREKALRELAVAAERLADQLGRPLEATQPRGEA